jgi:hypothetical protein
MNSRTLVVCLSLAMPWSAIAGAPAGRYIVATDTVYDNVTKITWQRAPSTGLTWLNALSTCAALDLDGHDDWRLPNIKELFTIVDYKASSPAIDGTAFPSTPNVQFWASTPYRNNYGWAWTVDFLDGQGKTPPTSEQHLVRCVR